MTVTVVAVAPTPVSADQPTVKLVNSTELADRADATLDAYDRWVDSNQPIAWIEFVAERDQFAHDVAAATEIDGEALAAEWGQAPVENQIIVVAALSQLGVRYRTNAMNPNESFDCSGLTKWAYSLAGVELPRVSWSQIRSAEQVDREEAEPGDLVQYPGHIGLYLGQGGFIDSPNTGNVVRVHDLPNKSSLRFGDATPG